MKLKEAAKDLGLIAFYMGLGIAGTASLMDGMVKVQEDR